MCHGLIGSLMLFAGKFPPKNWAFCEGQLLPISSNPALFAILGTTYGGNGTTTFALPDLRGRAAIGAGQGPGLPDYQLGQATGAPQTTILASQMPMHNHLHATAGTEGVESMSVGRYMAAAADRDADHEETLTLNMYGATEAETARASAIGVADGSEPVSIMQPVLVLNYIICVSGAFPTRRCESQQAA